MLVTLLDIARTVRTQTYRLTESTILGVPVDVPLHFIAGTLIFVIARRYLDARRAWWILIALVAAKELVDLFLKSSVHHIRVPSATLLLDIIVDVSVGLLGGYAADLWRRISLSV